MEMHGPTDLETAAQKTCVAKFIADETIKSARLTEIGFDDGQHAWQVTLGFCHFRMRA